MRLKRDPIGVFQEPDTDGPIPQPGDTPPPRGSAWSVVVFIGAVVAAAIAADYLIPPYGWWGAAVTIVAVVMWGRKP